jgi:N-acetylneuraminate synthase
MADSVRFGEREIGPGRPAYVIAEIGINHNGDVELARRLIDAAVRAGSDAVKFQKRTPEVCVPPHQRDLPRDTPWGVMTYLDYRRRLEFGADEFETIVEHCSSRGIDWLASSWDRESVAFVEQFQPIAHKVASACLTDSALLDRVAATGRPVILSTGMSTMEEIRDAVTRLPVDRLLVAHSTSTYPCPPDTLNLRMLHTLRDEFDCPIGYSGHEVGLQTTVAAVALGACFVERHITLDRAMWGSDQAASVEPDGFARLVRDIRIVQAAMGDGVKHVYDGEVPVRHRLRRV